MLQEKFRKLRLMLKVREIAICENYEKKIENIKTQLNSNAALWDSIAESEKREGILKQELVFAHQSIASSEKIINQLKEELKKAETEKSQLLRYKVPLVYWFLER